LLPQEVSQERLTERAASGCKTGSVPLYGCESELRTITELLRTAEATGGRAALVIRGEAGIGKSSLLTAASLDAERRGIVALSTQRAALKAAFGMADAAAPELFLIALATLELLAGAATRAPLLVIAEDAQWFDRPSLDVLALGARRVNLEPIVVLVAIREGWPSALEAAGLPDLRLEPLDDDVAAALLDECAPDLAPGLRERVLGEAAGNPLALVALPRALQSRDPVGTAVPLAPPPLTARLERAFSARATEL